MNDKVKEREVQKVEVEETETTKQTTGKETSEIPSVDSPASTTSLKTMNNQQLATLDYSDFHTPGRMLALAEVLVKGNMCPLKKPADVVIALMTGRDLDLPVITSISQIYPINGTPTLGTHIQKGIALKNGIIFERVRHAEDYYIFVEKDEDNKPKLVDNKPVEIKKGFLDEQPDNTLKSKIDTVTIYEGTREIKTASGKWVSIKRSGSFSISEAKQADLLGKDNWKKYWKDMLDARAFDRFMTEIADDLKLGLKSPEIISEGEVQEPIIIN